MKKIYIALIIFVLIIGSLGVYAYNTQKNLSEKLIRLHIIANSDSVLDQETKYKVRDFVLNKYDLKSENIESQSALITENLKNIENDVNDFLFKEGIDYVARAEFGESTFPTKIYGNLKLPNGKYKALKIILGNGQGQNWWCVMFPPMCFTSSVTGKIDEESDEYLKNNLSKSNYELVTADGYEVRFKIVEIYNKISSINNN